MQTEKLLTIGAFVLGLVLTLILASFLTPRSWWKRPNARALLILAGGTWALGSVLLHWLPVPAQAPMPATASASASAAAPIAIAAPAAGQPFQVHHDLNLRAGAAVSATRLGVVPSGALVRPTGARDGDWWQIKATLAGREQTGWASSLWLRRAEENATAPSSTR